MTLCRGPLSTLTGQSEGQSRARTANSCGQHNSIVTSLSDDDICRLSGLGRYESEIHMMYVLTYMAAIAGFVCVVMGACFGLVHISKASRKA